MNVGDMVKINNFIGRKGKNGCKLAPLLGAEATIKEVKQLGYDVWLLCGNEKSSAWFKPYEVKLIN